MSDKNNNTVDLTRQENGQWMVDHQFPASSANLEVLLTTLHDQAVKEPVSRAAHNTVVKSLAANSVKVEIYQNVFRIDLFGKIKLFPHSRLTRVFYVGGATQSNRGTYMLMEGSFTPFVIYLPGLRGFVSPRYSPISKYWRDYTIFKKSIPEISEVKVELLETPHESYIIRNNNNTTISFISLPDQQNIPGFDTLKALNFLSGFRNLNFEALLNDMESRRKDSILSSQPFILITLTDTSGVEKMIKTYHKPGSGIEDIYGNIIPYDMDRLYALVNDGQDFVLIQYFAFDRVLRPKSFFMKE